MVISGKAFKFVADSVNRLRDPRWQAAWGGARAGEILTEAQIDAALYAIEREMARLRQDIDGHPDDPDATADARNDLALLLGIERRLRDRTGATLAS
jgi:hypothetical protein